MLKQDLVGFTQQCISTFRTPPSSVRPPWKRL
jgi:hypothetical protein